MKQKAAKGEEKSELSVDAKKPILCLCHAMPYYAVYTMNDGETPDTKTFKFPNVSSKTQNAEHVPSLDPI